MRTMTGFMCAALIGCAGPQEETMQATSKSKGSCCATTCCADEAEKPASAGTGARQVAVDFLYLDLTVCERCRGTDQVLDEAMADLKSTLKAAGVELAIRKVHVTSEEQARKLAFVSSPTVRVQGRDVQLNGKESACGECGDLADCGVECRVWTWRGQDHTVPPKEMLVDAVLRAVYAEPSSELREPQPLSELPANLRKFFQGRK